MPRLVPDGPDIPDALLEAWDDDRVVLFCGAGVSARAGLPSFNGLVDEAYRQQHLVPPSSERARGFPDRLLGELEHRFGSRSVRVSIVQRLSRDNGDLATHKALIELARFRDQPGFRLVTTNFDHLFERAAAESGAVPLCHEAPGLPSPSDDQHRSFKGLVYLHGRIADGEADHRRLVLTSADLGTAYLTEGYARRFVLRLVREFTPVFVGYSLTDPTLRYLFDAIGAEEANRRRPRSAPAAFIFRPEGADESLPRVVEVIPYDPRDEGDLRHGLLHRTLEAWSTWRRNPTTRLRGILRNGPVGLPPPDLELGAWSVLGRSREPGFGAAVFRELGQLGEDAAPPSIDWLDVLGSAEARQERVHAERLKSWQEGGRRGPAPEPPRRPLLSLVTPAHDAIVLEDGAGHLANWLVCHLASPKLARWTVERMNNTGRRLHPHLRHLVRGTLASGTTAEPFASFWHVLAAEAAWAEPSGLKDWSAHRSPAGLLHQLARDELLTCLEPRVELAPSTLRELAAHLSRAQGNEPDATRPWQLRELADLRVELACGAMARTIIDRALQLDQRSLAELAWPVTELLARCLELRRLLDGQASLRDHPDHGLPISQAPDHADGWRLLRPLLWKCWQALDGKEGQASRLLIERWRMLPHATFERFVLAAMGASPHLAADELLAALLAQDARLLWDWRTLPDLEQPLRRLWLEVDDSGRNRFLAALAAPPAGEQQPPRDGCGVRLSMLSRAGGPPLPEWAEIHLAVFEAKRARAEEGQEVTVGELLALADDDLLQRLRSDRNTASEAAWRAAVSQEPLRALRLLDRLLTDAAVPQRAALEVVWRISGAAADEKLATEALAVLADLPLDATERSSDVASAVARFVAAAVERGTGDPRTDAQLLALWDRLIGPIATATAKPRGHAAGILSIDDLVRALLLHLERAHGSDDARRREEIRSRLDRLATDEVIFEAALWELGHWLPFVNDLEPAWTEAHLLPAFDWGSDPARASFAWEAYLSGSAVLPAKLWPKVCRPFINAFKPDSLDRLSPHARERLVQVLVGVLLFGADRPLGDDDTRQALRSCDLPMLRSAAWFLWRVVADEDQRERRDALWRSRLGRLMRDLWPKEVDKQGRKVWAWLLRMAVALDETFEDAVAAVLALPSPATIENAGLFDEMAKSSHLHKSERAEAVGRLLALPIQRFGNDDELIGRMQAKLAAHGSGGG